MSKRSIASIFSALTLGTALSMGAASPAQAEETTLCKSEGIFDVFETARGTQAFGIDGCVYRIINGNPLPVKNYDLENGREAERFANEHAMAQQQSEREMDRIYRQREYQQRRCENAQQRAIDRGLDSLIRGRGINPSEATRVLRDCNSYRR